MSAEETRSTNTEELIPGTEEPTLGPIPIPTDLEVEVVDTKSPASPIPGATVRLFRGTVKIDEKITNNRGIVLFSNLEADAVYRVEAEKEGYAKESIDVYVIEGYNSITIALDYQVTVTVLDNVKNTPIAGARVSFSWFEAGRERSITRETDSQGRAVFELSHGSYSLIVNKSGYVTYSGSVTIDRPGVNIPVRLNPLLVVITVLNVPRTPPRTTISAANVVVRRDGQQVASGTTDQYGMVSFGLEPGTYEIIASKEGHRPGSATVNYPQQTEVYVELVLIGVELQVEVINSQTQAPIRGATVTVKRGNQIVASGTTNEYGIAFFELDSDEYVIEVQAQGFNPGSTSVVLAQDQRVTVALNPALQPRYNLEITVVDYKNRPISGATVTVSRGGQRVDSKTTGQDGKVAFQLEQGSYTVETFKSGYKQPVQISVNLDRDRSESLTLPGYRLTVTVRDSRTGQPITGASVRVIDQSTGREVDSGTTA